MTCIRRFALPLLLLLVLGGMSIAADPPTFEKDLLPLFQARCLKCHGAEQQKADLDMRSKAALLKGGESGPAVKPGSPSESVLWEYISKDQMPPKKEDRLTAEEKKLVRDWIASGAK